jgi:hypothetical protein
MPEHRAAAYMLAVLAMVLGVLAAIPAGIPLSLNYYLLRVLFAKLDL